MNIKIRKGCHWRSNHLLTRLHVGREWRLRYAVTFDASAQYHLMANRTQVNKLVGIGVVHHHLNSMRIGWRHTDEKGLELVAYYYYNGRRGYRPLLDHVEVNRPIWIEVTVKFNKSGYVQAEAAVNGSTYCMEVWRLMKWWERIPVMYECFPYFGGMVPAPNDINIKINRLWQGQYGTLR